MARVLLGVRGMTGEQDTARVEKLLLEVDGVTKASVSYRDKQAAIEYDETEITTIDLIRALRNEGFQAGME